MIITRSHAKSRLLGGEIPSQTARIEMEECCCMCNKELEEGTHCYRHTKTDRTICTGCAVDIAVAR